MSRQRATARRMKNVKVKFEHEPSREPIEDSSSHSEGEPMDIDEHSSQKRSKVVNPRKKEVKESSTSDPCKKKDLLPFSNVQEKIILVLDRAEDETYTHFEIDGMALPPLSMLKFAIKNFLQLKHSIDKTHQYALVLLNENSSTWELDFTNDYKSVINHLNDVDPCEAEDIFDLNSLLDIIERNINVPHQLNKKGLLVPPPYIVRVILFYSRSYTIPQLEPVDVIKNLLTSPYFILDILMTHEPEDVDNNCSKILNVLQNIDTKGLAYFFSVQRNAKLMCNCIGKLLGHPLQRPKLKEANYKLAKS